MSEVVRVCSAAELPPEGQVAEFTVQGRAFCVARVQGAICILDGVCPHEGGPLGEGSIEDGRVACPWHNYSFDLHTGQCAEDASLKAQVFESELVDGELRAKL